MRLFAILLLALACGCQRDPGTAYDELAAEMRALRMQLNATGRADSGRVDFQAQLDAALTPLREAFTRVGQDQRALAARQVELAAELTNWTRLVAGSLQQDQQSQAEQLAARLRELERELTAQNERHQQVEALLGGALDRTAKQLEQFLERVQNVAGGGASAPPEGGGSEDEPAATGAVKPVDTPTGSASGESNASETDPPRQRQAKLHWLWWSLPFAAVATGIALLVRQRQLAPVELAPEMQMDRGDPAAAGESFGADSIDAVDVLSQVEPDHDRRPTETFDDAFTDLATAPPDPRDEPDVEELWAAAALLGEAIGRLRHSQPDEPEPAAEATLERPAEDTTAAPEPEQPAPHPQPPEPEPAVPRMTAPDSMTVRAVVRDSADAERHARRVLLQDPRVLLHPAPVVRCQDDLLEATFSTLPRLSAGERSLIEQRLRDAVA